VPGAPNASVERPRHAGAATEHAERFAEIVASLRLTPKQLSSKYFYDAAGSVLFDQICEQPEYYLPRVETAILRERLPAFAREIGSRVMVIEPGSGASTKTLILLDALQSPAAYVPVDISYSHLTLAAKGLRQRYPALEVRPVCADFTRPFSLPRLHSEASRTLVFFPGSTIGNFDRGESVELLRHMRRIAGPGGLVLVGADQRKDPAILQRAYNDAAGITEAFNRNILTHLNREYGFDFDAGSFVHRAFWVETASRIEMHLESTRAQVVHAGAEHFEIARGERIWTESCHKYDAQSFGSMAADAELEVIDAWLDRDGFFSVQVLQAARTRPADDPTDQCQPPIRG
jgi:dimethylhistidine N-methyltransferase